MMQKSNDSDVVNSVLDFMNRPGNNLEITGDQPNLGSHTSELLRP